MLTEGSDFIGNNIRIRISTWKSKTKAGGSSVMVLGGFSTIH